MGKQSTKKGEYGTLRLYRVEYRNEGDNACPVFSKLSWGYDREHVEDKFYGGIDAEGWEILSIKPAALASEVR